MNRFLFGYKNFKHRTYGYGALRGRDARVIFAMVVVVGLPWLLVQVSLFRQWENLFPVLASRFNVGPDMLTAATMTAYCLLLGFALLAGHRFLRRSLRQGHAE